MKTMKALILAALLAASQAYAWGEREQAALMGFIGGVIVTNAVKEHSASSGSAGFYVGPARTYDWKVYREPVRHTYVYGWREPRYRYSNTQPRKRVVVKEVHNHYYGYSDNRRHGHKRDYGRGEYRRR